MYRLIIPAYSIYKAAKYLFCVVGGAVGKDGNVGAEM